jgi:hypothetical protein
VRVALAVALIAAVAAPAYGAARAPVAVNGTVTLGAVRLASCTRVDAVDAKVVECSRSGRFAGRPARANAKYAWHWHLFHGGEVPQTAHGDEDGILTVVFPTGSITLQLAGSKSAGATRGTWRYQRGTKRFARRRGTGTYRFETTASPDGFGGAKLTLRGTLR